MNISYSLIIPFLFLCICNCRAEDPTWDFCNKDTNISSNSKISANIDKLLPELVSKTASTGFTATTYGKDPDKVYGLAQCRGDVVSSSSKDCSSCIQEAAEQIRKRCPNQADSRIRYEYCLLRYSNRDFFGQVDTSYGIIYYNVENVTDPEKFNKELGALTDKIRSEAVMAKNKGLGKGKTKLSPFLTLYALVECTQDLSPLNCAQCLAIAVGNFPTICGDKKGCRVVYSSCYVRYELYPFYFPLDSNATSSSSVTSKTVIYP